MMTVEQAYEMEAKLKSWTELHPNGTPKEFADYCEQVRKEMGV